MNSVELTDSFLEFKELKNIDKQTMQHVLEDVFRAMLKKKFNTDEHIDIIVNIDKGDVQIFLNKEIVLSKFLPKGGCKAGNIISNKSKASALSIFEYLFFNLPILSCSLLYSKS